MEQQPLELATIKIKNGNDDYLIINLRDFNPDVHEAYDSPPLTEPKPVGRRRKEEPKEETTSLN